MMTTVPLSEAKTRLSELVDTVDRTQDRVMITKNGRGAAVIVSACDAPSLEATLELLADPEAQDRVRASKKELATGDVVTGEELAVLLEHKRAGRSPTRSS